MRGISFAETPVTLLILIVTVTISLLAFYRNQSLYYKFILKPDRMVEKGEWYRFITSGFIHGDMIHLLFNMLTFYFFAPAYERVAGSGMLIIVYLASMVLADITTVIKNKDNPNYAALGASGAVAGLLFSAILYFPDMSLYLMFIPIPIPAPLFAILYLVYCWYAGKKADDNINHDAHMWGALAGILLTALLDFSTVKGLFQLIF